MVRLLFLLGGVALVALVLSDIFQSVIVPRPARRRLRPSSYISRWGWRGWRWAGHSLVGNEAREDFLGVFAPLLLVVLLVFWIASLVAGYGMIFYALRDELKPVPDFGAALYFAGTSLLTIGYGDIVPTGGAARAVALAAGASGFGSFAIVTTFLFSIFGAYQSREAFVVFFTNRAGAPPSGVEILETHARLQLVDSLLETLVSSQHWMAQLLETHLAYPVLTYFRSTHDHISWAGVLGAILDGSTLVITTLDVPSKGEAVITNRLGRHVINDFASYFRLDDGDDVGVERDEFDRAYDRLAEAGIPLRDRDRAWEQFAQVRSTYAGALNQMAQFWRIPPAQWIGDRSLIGHAPPMKVITAPLREA